MKLACPDCRHENEPERIYCHECGARLNRTTLIREQTAAREEDSAETHRRLERMLNPKGVIFRANLKMLGKVLSGAFVAALLVLALSAPEGSPPSAASAPLELGPQIGLDLENVLSKHRGGTFSYTEDQVNGYLRNVLKRKKANLDKPFLQFEGGRAGFDEGVCRITAIRSIFGYPIFFRTDNTVATRDGRIDAQNCGGALGRLPVHPALMKYLDFLFADVWSALQQDRKQVAEMSAIQFHPKMVVLTAPAL